MKDKIFQALKQAFPQLGLGDEILMGRAEALDATGLVTEDNLQAVVSSQQANLEALQKSNDKRVADALAKAKKDSDAAAAKLKAEHEAALKAEKDNLAAIKKELDELKAKNPGGQGGQETNAQIDALKAAYDEKLKEVNGAIAALKNSNSDYEKQIKAMQDEKAAAEKAAAAKARLEMINAKAKEAGIPEWRIAEGFSISDDMDETKITETLAGVAANIKKQLLPTETRFSGQGDGQAVSAEDATSIVKGILRK